MILRSISRQLMLPGFFLWTCCAAAPLVHRDTTATPAAESRARSDADLQHLRFHSKVLPLEGVELVDGRFRQPAAPGSASELRAELTEWRVLPASPQDRFGAVVIVTSTGGSGSFYELALLERINGGWTNVDTVLLGDRIRIQSLALDRKTVVVRLVEHGPGEPMCCPTVDATRRFEVRRGRLVPAQ